MLLPRSTSGGRLDVKHVVTKHREEKSAEKSAVPEGERKGPTVVLGRDCLVGIKLSGAAGTLVFGVLLW